jgi:MtN3 and saliva related transmembrane protein
LEAWLGWLSSAVLLFTLMAQVVKQWGAPSVEAVSGCLFFGQISASVGFIAYSGLVGNIVFVVTNSLILLTSIFGECIYLYRRSERS